MSSVENRQTVKWRIPSILRPLTQPKRNKVVYGGRGGGKSMNIATIIAGLLYMRQPIMGQPFRVLCGREYQNSISDSVHYEIVAAIWRLGLAPYFKITQSGIICLTTGAQVIYRGLHNNIDQIKSYGGIDLFWGEEAHSFTEDSLIYIEPTIRRDPPFGPFGQGSELWYSFNQTLDSDPIYLKFKCSMAVYPGPPFEPDESSIVIPCTWKDNQYFPQVLKTLRAKSEALDPPDHYNWVWGTQCRNLGGIFFAMQDLLVRGEPPEFPPICDGVFAVIDTAVKTGKENDATAVTYFAHTQQGAGIPLMVLDYDVEQIQGSMLEVWLPSVFMRLQTLATECKARFGVTGVFIEDKSSGSILLQQAAKMSNLGRSFPIESKLTAMGKVERAIAASPYVARGMCKFTKPAYDKVITYKGVTANHLLTQIKSFRIGDTDGGADDALDTFCYGCVIALGNAEGM